MMQQYMDNDIEDIVDEITNEKFITFCGIDGCNETILDAVRELVKSSVERLIWTEKKSRDEVISMESPKLEAMFRNEKRTYESMSTRAYERLRNSRQQPNIQSSWSNSSTSNNHQQVSCSQQQTVLTEKDVPKVTQKPSIVQKPIHTLAQPTITKAANTTTTSSNSKGTVIDSSSKLDIEISYYEQDVDVWSRVKGLEIRGQTYKVSSNGSCPTCGHKSNIFVILDHLFPAGDMPELLNTLLSQGKAVLWSSKQNMNCKDPPTFLCSGNCPFTNIKKCGFNLDWKQTDLERIFSKSRGAQEDDHESDVPSDESHDSDHHRNQSDENFDHDREDGSSVDEEEEYDEGHVDIEFYRKVVSWFVLDDYVDENDSLIPDEEKDMIRTMLALEQARNDFIDGKMKVRLPTPDPPAVEESNDVILISSPEHQDEDSNGIPSKSNSNGSSPRSKQTEHGFDNEKAKKVPEKEKYDLEDFPVSTNGACPYCHSNNVVYIILKESENEKRQLPDLLVRLVGDGKAEVNVKGDDEWPSFQCRNCTYGFNLDWNKTNLEKIFYPTHHDKSKSTWNRPLANSTVTSTTSLTLNRPIGVGQHPMAPGIPSAMASQQHVPHLSTLPRVPFPQPFIPPLMWGPMIPPPMPFPGMIPHPLPMQPAPMYPMASVSQQPVRSVIPQGAVPVPSSQVPITVASQLLAAAQKAKESQPAPTPQQPLSQPTNVASANISEDEKIKAVMAQQATVSGIDPAQYEKAKVPHPMYVCYRCGGKGHFVRQCPTHEVPITVASKFLAVAQKKQALVTQAVAGAKQKAQELQEKHQQTVSHTSTPGYFSQRTWDPPPPPPPPEAGSESKTLSTTDVSKVPATVASEHIVSHTSTPGYYSQRTWDPPPPPTTDVDKANDVTIDLTKDDKAGNADEKTAAIDLTNEAESRPIEDDVKTDQPADSVNKPLAVEGNNSLPVKENNKALTDFEQNPNGTDKDTLMEDLTVNDEREDLSKTNYRKRALEKEENNEDNDVIKVAKIEKEDDVNIVEHSLALSTEQQTLISNYNKRKATPTLDPLQNLEHLLDDASSEISLSPGDLGHGTGTNISKVLAAEPTSGSTSPFTDSLFNMVTEDVVKEIESDVDISKVKLENVDYVPIKKSRNEAKDVAGKDLKTSKLKTENIDFVPKKEPQSEAMVAKQQKQQPKKVVYVSLEDDESSSLDEKESDDENITNDEEKEDVVKEVPQRTTRKSAARAAKRLNVSNFF